MMVTKTKKMIDIMKAQKIFSSIASFALVALIFISCDKDAVKPTLNNSVTANQLLVPTSSSNYVLTVDNADKVAEVFKWTAPNFGFKASVSYKVQMDVAAGNFSNAVDLVSSDTLTASILVKDFNSKLLGLGLAPET